MANSNAEFSQPLVPIAPATPPRLLVVEDDRATREALRDLLAEFYAVEIAANGQAALDALRCGPRPDLILSDVFMPHVDGLSLLRALRARDDTAALPVLLITATNDEQTRLRGFEAGADDFIRKPFSPRELLARVRTHLDLARLRREEGARNRQAAADAALRASDARYRTIVNQVTVGVAEIDAEGRFLLVNRKFGDLLGYSADEMLQRKVSDITHPDDLPFCLELLQRTLTTGEPSVHEKRHLHKDGAIIWVNDCMSLIHAQADQPARVVAVATDITESKRTQEALRLSEAHFRLVVTSVREYAIFTLDAQGRVATWNRGCERLKGYRSEEIIGRSATVFSTPEDLIAQVPERQLSRAVAHGVAAGESWRVRKDGTRFWGEELLFPMRGTEGDLLGFVKICRDQSERKTAEDERLRLLASERAARREAEAANAAKDRFLSVLSHELRTPLVPVQMALYVLDREAALSDAARESLEMIRRNVAQETRLIGDLLDVTRIVHGKLPLASEPVRLHDCLRGAIEEGREKIDGKNLDFTLILYAERDGILGDAARLRQALGNLLQNAVKFTAKGGKVAVRSHNTGDAIIVAVSDTGVGIEEETLPRLFRAFEPGMVESARPHGGMGVGLSIASAIVQSLGGRLTAASAGPGQGATFTVELPLSAA